MCAERSIAYIDHTNSIQPENHLKESKLHFNRDGIIAFADSISEFSLSVIDGVIIVAILIIFFQKILIKNRKVFHKFHTKKTIGE